MFSPRALLSLRTWFPLAFEKKKKTSLFLFIKWTSESCGCSSRPEPVGSLSQSLSQSLTRMENKNPKPFNWNWDVWTKRSGLASEMWFHMGIPSFVFNGNTEPLPVEAS